MEKTTTIQVKMSTKKKLSMLKIAKEESMDSVIARLVALAEDTEPLSGEDIRGIERSLNDIKKGKMRPAEEVFKEAGL